MKSIVFWCEFPYKTDFGAINQIDFPCEIYFACRNISEFLKWKAKVRNEKIKCGAWPVLSIQEGYWFSGYSSCECIDKLKEFSGIDIKIDIEPPIFRGKLTFWRELKYFSQLIFSGKNNLYLQSAIKEMERKGKVIASTFPFPDFVLKRFGGDIECRHKNMFVYRSVFSFPINKILDVYYNLFVRKELNRGITHFAIGCFGHGIFGNELIFDSVDDLKQEIKFMSEKGVENLVIFELSWISNQKNFEEWSEEIGRFLM